MKVNNTCEAVANIRSQDNEIMIRCKNCRKTIDSIITSKFDYEGIDSDYEYPLEEAEEDAVLFETDTNWTGYGLTEEEIAESIKCPHCDKFPFYKNEVQVYNVVRVVCFKAGDIS